MEVAGVEPASGNLSVKTSPITVGYQTFPRQGANQHAPCLSSFIGSFSAAKLRRKSTPHNRRRLPDLRVFGVPGGDPKVRADGRFN